MAEFDSAFTETMKQETPWRKSGSSIVFLPKVTSDTGGSTKWGVSQKAYPALDIPNLTFSQARSIYIDIWNDTKAGLIRSQRAANLYFDHAVNAGNSAAKSVLRKSLAWLGAPVSSKTTLDALIAQANRYPTNLPAALAKFRKAGYQKTVDSDPQKYGTYLKKWEKRVDSFFPAPPQKV